MIRAIQITRKKKERFMKSKAQLIGVTLALALISLMPAPRALAQQPHDQNSQIVWRKGMVSLSKSAWAGDVRLKSGMYHVKHVMEGTRHVIVFQSVALPAGKEFSMWEGKEVARLACVVAPAKEVRNTKVRLGKNAAGQSVILEIQIAGEKVKYTMSVGGQQLSKTNQ